jgi:hypothetical protein
MRGSRIVAACEAMRIVVSCDDALTIEQNHVAACAELCRRMDAKSGGDRWSRPKVYGFFGGECFHVFVPSGGA